MNYERHKNRRQTHFFPDFSYVTHRDYFGNKWSKLPYLPGRNPTYIILAYGFGPSIGVRAMFSCVNGV